jgi:hypothetical protein
MNQIKNVSYCFRLFFQFLFVVIPIVQLIAWCTSPESLVTAGGYINMNIIPYAYIATADHPSRILHELTSMDRILGFFVSTLPMLVKLYILYALIKLFKLYETGEIFTLINVRYLRNIGYALLIGQIINPIYQALMGVVLTWNNPPGYRIVAIQLDQTNIGIFFTALLVILISWIMAEGCKLREEQQLTV